MYTGTHRLVKIYQGMSKRAKVAFVTGVLAVATAASVVPSLAATSPTYSDTSATVVAASILPLNFGDVQHTLSVVASGVHSSAAISIPSIVGDPATQITPIANGDTLTFAATTHPVSAAPYTFAITSTNIPTGITWSTNVNPNTGTDVLTAQVVGSPTFPIANATVTAKVTDALGDVTIDTVTFSPTVATSVNEFNVWQTADAVPAISPLYANNNTTGNVDFTVPVNDNGVLSNAPQGVSLENNSLVAVNAAPGTYDNVKLTVSDAAGAASVETFDLSVVGARVGYQGPVLSGGHAMKVNGSREDVFFIQSGAASWDKFTIVGPGKINGHQGWVNGKVGLNEAVYGGLENNHGYTVYYQPVTGQGGSTPVDGSKMGYVYFVS